MDNSTVVQSGHGCCATREIVGKDKEAYVKCTLKELLVYIFFLLVVCCAAYELYDESAFYLGDVLIKIFVDVSVCDSFDIVSYAGFDIPIMNCVKGDATFRTLTTQVDAAFYLNTTLMYALYWNITSRGRDLTDDELGFIGYENEVVGPVRFRQVRVRNDSCIIQSELAGPVEVCMYYYSTDAECTNDYGRNERFTYQSDDDLEESSYEGILSRYGGGGFVEHLNITSKATTSLINDMIHDEWIDRKTRAIFVDFTVANTKLDLLCISRLLIEFSPIGSVVTSFSFIPVRRFHYDTAFGTILLVLEIIFCLFLTYYVVEEIIEIRALGSKYWTRFWNYVDLLLTIIGIVCVILCLTVNIMVHNYASRQLSDPTMFVPFFAVGFWQVFFNSCVAMVVLLAWIKLFKFLNVSSSMKLLALTFERSAKDVACFAIVFVVIFLAFTQLGFVIFGTCAEFSTFALSAFTLFRIILGDCNFKSVAEASSVYGPVYFVLYIVFVLFIGISMFMAIVNDAYAAVRRNESQKTNSFHIMDYVYKILHINELHRRKPIKAKTLRLKMATMGYSGESIDNAFVKHAPDRRDLDDVSPDEESKLLIHLEQQRIALLDLHGSTDVSMIQQQTDNLQELLLAMYVKVDDSVRQLRNSTIGRSRRELRMSKLVDALAEADGSGDPIRQEEVLKSVMKELENI